MDTKAVEDLNFLLKDELAASAAYQKVLSKLEPNGDNASLQNVLHSHQARAEKLKAAVLKLGGEPLTEPSIGDKIGKLVIEGAAAISHETAVGALTEAEGGWTSNYEWRLVNMHGDYRNLVKDELLPEQKKSEEKLRELEKSANKGLWPAAPGTKDI